MGTREKDRAKCVLFRNYYYFNVAAGGGFHFAASAQKNNYNFPLKLFSHSTYKSKEGGGEVFSCMMMVYSLDGFSLFCYVFHHEK